MTPCINVPINLMCRSVLAWRKWFHKQGQGGYWRQIGREASPAPELTREQLLDRYHQHTKHCPACSKVPCSCCAFTLPFTTHPHSLFSY